MSYVKWYLTFSFLYNAQKIKLKNVKSAEVLYHALIFIDIADRGCYTHRSRAGNVPGIVPGIVIRAFS